MAALFAGQAHAVEAPVTAALVIPPAETYVIGDTVPLYWRFENRSTQALAFMWEGCCRLNGRLAVTQAGQPVAPVPPGQALAHMFAKAERLDPGQPRDFETRLSDWVFLTETGTYALQGRYVGVLPDQRPQVPKSLALWRDAAETPPMTVALLSTADYLNQREDRERRRQLKLEFEAPSALPPLEPVNLRLRLTNLSDVEQKLAWPDSFELWLVNAKGQRVTSAGTLLEGPYAELRLPPRGSLERAIPLSSSALEGEPFGAYRLFVDLKAVGTDQPRVPSPAATITWELGPGAVKRLLEQAAQGVRTGARNAPLKLLRVYVAELGPMLAQLESAEIIEAARPLLDQLRLAAGLKPISPKPGRVDLALRVTTNGTTEFVDDRLTQCLAPMGLNLTNRLAGLLRVRRHLGWEVGVVLIPAEAVSTARLIETAEPLRSLQADLAGPVRIMPAPTTNTVAGAFCVAAPGPVADVGLVLVKKSNAVTVWAAHPAPAAVPRGAGQLAGFRELETPDELETFLAELAVSSPRVWMLTSPEATVGDVFRFGAPLLRRGLQVSFDQIPR